jgi:hypothetical protein
VRVPCSPHGIVKDENVRTTLIGTYFQKNIIWAPEEEQGTHTQRRRMGAPSLTPKKLKTTHLANTRPTEGPPTSGLCYWTRERLLRCFA